MSANTREFDFKIAKAETMLRVYFLTAEKTSGSFFLLGIS